MDEDNFLLGDECLFDDDGLIANENCSYKEFEGEIDQELINKRNKQFQRKKKAADKQSNFNTIGARIRAARLEKGFTQAELAKEAGISQKRISIYEQDKEDPTTKTIQKLAKALDVDAYYLMDGWDKLYQKKDVNWCVVTLKLELRKLKLLKSNELIPGLEHAIHTLQTEYNRENHK